MFKPFVYAAAFDNAVQGLQPVVTPVTTVEDIPTTFDFDGKEYTPDNYSQEFYGTVTVRDALIHSLNVATVKVAEMIGYQRVVDLARQMGLGSNIKATPAVALGAYEMTPMDVAAGYTAFAANGVRAEPIFIRQRRFSGRQDRRIERAASRPVLDPRVAFLVTSLMEDVINHGTGIRSAHSDSTRPPPERPARRATAGLPAIHRIFFASCGWASTTTATSIGRRPTAAPIWGEFMKRAVSLPTYRNTQPFHRAGWVMEATVDPQSGLLATASCPQTINEYFIEGSEPTQYCPMHGGKARRRARVPGYLTYSVGATIPPRLLLPRLVLHRMVKSSRIP